MLVQSVPSDIVPSRPPACAALTAVMVGCAVVGCNNNSVRDKGKGFFRIPKVIKNSDPDKRDEVLTSERRTLWLHNISRADLTDGARICGDHFVSGKPAALYDRRNSDWAPTVKMGLSKQKRLAASKTTTKERRKKQKRPVRRLRPGQCVHHRPVKMCGVQTLRDLVQQRLSAAAEEIFGLFERTIAEYEEEIDRQRRLLEDVVKPEIQINKADVQQLLVSKEEVPPEQQEWSPSLEQEEPEPPHIKEEQEELWSSQEGEQLQGLEEADITKFPFTPVPVKSEDDEEKAQSEHVSLDRETSERMQSVEGQSLTCQCVKMSKVQKLRSLVSQRLTAAVEEIFGLFERTIAEYQCDAPHLKSSRRQQLDVMFKPDIRLHGADGVQLLVSKEEVPPEQQEWSPSLEQEEPEPPHIKEEQEELWSSQEGEQLQGLEEADITKFPFTPVPVKSEDDEEKAQSSQLHQSQSEENREAEPLASSSTEQMETEADGEDCGGSEPDRNLDPASDLQPTSDGQLLSSHSSEAETEDSEDDWEETREPQSGLNMMKHKICNHKGNIQTHMRRHSREKQFVCPVCGKDFSLKAYLMLHVRVHTEEKLYRCSLCNKSFSQSGGGSQHMTRHMREKPFSCSVCDKSFSRKATLIRHTTGHSGEKPFHCSLCGKKFVYSHNMKNHMRVHTGETPFSCLVCGEIHSTKATVNKHVRINTAEKRFGHRGVLEKHMRDHRGEKPSDCTACGRPFDGKHHLKRDTQSHTGEKPYSCSVCGKRVTRKQTLEAHMSAHTGEKPYGCTVCGKKFGARGNLNKHMIVHTGEKPFSCTICHKSFTRKQNLKRHMPVHAGGKLFSCCL